MANAFLKALDKEVIYNAVQFEVYLRFGFLGAEDLGNIFRFKHDFENYFCGIRKLGKSESLNPELQNFEFWLNAHKDKTPIE